MIPSDEAFCAPYPADRPCADPPDPPDPPAPGANEASAACEGEHIAPWTRPGAPASGPSDDRDALTDRALPVASFILAILLVLGDCSGSTVAPDQETIPVPMTESHTPPRTHTDTTPLDLRLEAPSRTRSGVHVPLRLVLSNPTPRPITIDLGGMPTAFDFVVHTVDGVEIWRRLEGTNIRDVLAPRTVEPGGSIRYTAIWPQRDDEGRPVRPGLYRVVGILPLDGVPGFDHHDPTSVRTSAWNTFRLSP